jgi:hypothetical protein
VLPSPPPHAQQLTLTLTTWNWVPPPRPHRKSNKRQCTHARHLYVSQIPRRTHAIAESRARTFRCDVQHPPNDSAVPAIVHLLRILSGDPTFAYCKPQHGNARTHARTHATQRYRICNMQACNVRRNPHSEAVEVRQTLGQGRAVRDLFRKRYPIA